MIVKYYFTFMCLVLSVFLYGAFTDNLNLVQKTLMIFGFSMLAGLLGLVWTTKL